MARVLVIDDSEGDRMIVETLLGKDPDLEIESLDDGEKALARVEQDPPEMVLTDLVMPGMDGLEVVAAMRERFPSIPVVLMTSQGNEEIAVRALKEGAMSYVPKRNLSTVLRETVREVLDLADTQRAEVKMLETLTRTASEFRLKNEPKLVRPLVKHLQHVAAQMGQGDEVECMQVGVALCEALSNALEHGNLQLPAALRASDIGAHRAMLRERRRKMPWRDRRIHVEAYFDREQASFVIRDEGDGFDPSAVPDPLDPDNIDKLTGRGIKLIRSFMDEVTYNEQGNQITMVKRCATD